MLLPGLYVITDRSMSRGRSDEEVVQAAIRGGATAIQLREKQLPRDELRALAMRLRDICRTGGATFIVNDDPELAAEVGADGVHLGPEDASPETARAMLGPGTLIGWSVKGSVELARQAQSRGVDYIAVGSIFPTSTKAGATVVGTETITRIRREVQLPIAAIGGITLANVRSVIEAGADLACTVSAVVGADDVEKTSRHFTAIIEEGLAQRG